MQLPKTTALKRLLFLFLAGFFSIGILSCHDSATKAEEDETLKPSPKQMLEAIKLPDAPEFPDLDELKTISKDETKNHNLLSSHPASTIQGLGSLGGNYGFAYGNNEFGQTVGQSQTSTGLYHAFFWEAVTGMYNLGQIVGDPSVAFSINNQEQITGYTHNTSGFVRAFFWENGTMIDLGTLGGYHSLALSINDQSQVVGRAHTTTNTYHAFLWENGTMIDLGTLGGNFSIAYDINNQGQVVGFSRTSSGHNHAFLWENGTMTDLGTLGGNSSIALGINGHGQVVGRSRSSNGSYHAFLWENGTMTDLGTLGGHYSEAWDINDLGHVVGWSYTTPNRFHGFLWDATNGMINLGGLDPTYLLSQAFSINNSGQITGGSVNTSRWWEPVIWYAETNKPPVAGAGADRTVECTGHPSTPVTLDGSGSSDPDGDPLTYSWSLGGMEIATGQTPTVDLALGSHTVTLTVTDPDGESDSDEVVIDIVDTTPPQIAYTVETSTLWPVNHRMVLAVSGISASDICDPNPSVTVDIVSNEAVNGRGDGNTAPDWEVAENGDGTFDVYLRAERSGRGNGRIYTVSMTAVDASGNLKVATVEVAIPHNQGRR